MERFRKYSTIAIMLIGNLFSISSYGSDYDVDSFYQLNDSVKRDVLCQYLTTWLEKTTNLKVNMHICAYNTQFENMIPHKDAPRESFQEFNMEYERIGDSYRTDYQWWPEGKEKNNIPNHDMVSGYDSSSGISRGYGCMPLLPSYEKTGMKTGRVYTGHSPMFANNNWYGLLFDGKYLDRDEYLIPFVLHHKKYIEFEKSRRMGEIQILLNTPKEEVRWKVRRMWFDPTKDYFLTHLEGEITLSKDTWFKGIYDIPDAKKINEIWVPMKLVQILQCYANKPGMGTIQETTIKNINIGVLTKNDLEIVFPSNSLIVDEIEGKKYRIDKQGKQTPYSSLGISTQPVRQKRYSNWLFYGTIAALVGLTVVFAYRRRRASPRGK